ncbi:hypothetical protein, partial [Lysobacter sp. TAB13]|uniref:hypothetical protein n=1 Tax=Lysobacter sp. TAB13 TaxID=3233065 RepID=UPI003F9AF155
VDISRDDRKVDFEDIFIEILNKRFPVLADKIRSSRSISEKRFARILGRAVTGNLRSFVFACNNINESEAVGYPELTRCLLFLSADYFWPLLEEVAPKLGSYEVLVQPAQSIAQFIFNNCAKKESSYCLVHRDIVQKQSKIFEILEYAGFFSV